MQNNPGTPLPFTPGAQPHRRLVTLLLEGDEVPRVLQALLLEVPAHVPELEEVLSIADLREARTEQCRSHLSPAQGSASICK